MLAVVHDDTLLEHTLRQIVAVSDAVVVCEHAGKHHLLPVDVYRTRRGGKDQRKQEAYSVDEASRVVFRSGKALSTLASAAGGSSAAADTEDPTAHLTFNLKLSEQEQSARSATALPYHMGQEQKQRALQAVTSGDSRTAAGAIYYEPDEFDDFDEEDPDDDLDL